MSLTGVVLLAFAFGWALLAVLSARFSTEPQRWAAAPAAFMAVAGLISLLPPGSVVQDAFSWVWPPVLFGLVVWMFIRSRRQLRSRGARWLLYAQDRMATLSTNSSHRAAKYTTHASLLYDETDSAAGSQAILDVVRSVRTGSPLVPQ